MPLKLNRSRQYTGRCRLTWHHQHAICRGSFTCSSRTDLDQSPPFQEKPLARRTHVVRTFPEHNTVPRGERKRRAQVQLCVLIARSLPAPARMQPDQQISRQIAAAQAQLARNDPFAALQVTVISHNEPCKSISLLTILPCSIKTHLGTRLGAHHTSSYVSDVTG